MKSLTILFFAVALCFSSCKETYSEWEFRNGQTVNLTVGPHYGARGDNLLITKTREVVNISLYDFENRLPGYTYNVRAKFVADDNPPMDGSSYYFVFNKVLSSKKYEGNDVFSLPLIQAVMPDPGSIYVYKKENGVFRCYRPNVDLIPANGAVKNKLEEINNEKLRVDSAMKMLYKTNDSQFETQLKWRDITATVRHNPENFGRSYIVENIDLTGHF